MLELLNVSKSYNSTLIFKIPSLKLENNVYWLKGVNGSGKTTLFKIIAGLLPFDGTISINVTNLKKQPVSYRTQIGWAETEPLYPSFVSGMDLIQLYCSIRKVKPDTVNSLVDIYNMNGYINNTLGTYSAGMSKKLSLVLAFIGNPKWIILDEPLITLDSDAYNSTLSLIVEKHKINGTSFLISSHQKLDSKDLDVGDSLFMNNKTIAYDECL